MAEQTYTQSVNELDELVKKMQSPECSIDELAGYTKRSLELLKVCKDKLTATDQELQKILATLDDNNKPAE